MKIKTTCQKFSTAITTGVITKTLASSSNGETKTAYEICVKVTVKAFEENMEFVLMDLFSLWYFTPISNVYVFDFEQINYVWVIYAFFPNFRCCFGTLQKGNKWNHIASRLKYAPDQVVGGGRKGEPSSNNINEEENLK